LKKTILILMISFMSFVFLSPSASAREEWKDTNKDGEKDTQIFYKGKEIVKIREDRNHDGKMDKTTLYKNGKKTSAEVDFNHDGKIDGWYKYTDKGALKQLSRDSNDDGRPDRWTHYLKGRILMQKEYDQNYDGKVDMRKLVQWDANKKLPVPIRGKIQYQPAPGYKTLWREEDSDYGFYLLLF